MRGPDEVVARLRRAVGERYVFADPYEARMVGYDAGLDEAAPAVAVLPARTDEVAEVVRIAAEAGWPIVARGGGTGLSGGATCLAEGVAVVLSRMNRVLDLDVDALEATVQAGLINLRLSELVRPHGLHFAPDPSSQKASTIGGNIAENAGGPHTLRYGVTSGHVLGVEMVLDGGEVRWFPHGALGPGYDLLGAICGSEGTLGLVTAARVRLTPLPEAWATVLAVFASVADAGAAVAAIVASGIVAAAVELIDRRTLQAVEAYVHAGYPEGAGAVLLVEVDGLAEEVAEAAPRVEEACRQCGALELRRARSEEERALLWKGRKEAGGALGRLARHYYVMDGVVPVSEVPRVLPAIEAIGEKYGLPIGNIAHAGDGNLHPNILFDHPEDIPRVLACADEIERLCLQVGGSISGEHGIGIEKLHLMAEMFGPEDLEMMRALHEAFDPRERFNPGKVVPARSGERPLRRPALDVRAGGWV